MVFPILEGLGWLRHAFLVRIPGVDVNCERQEAIRRLRVAHELLKKDAGFEGLPLALAEQVHGDRVVLGRDGVVAEGADGLATSDRGLCLGIYVADCAAVYLVDRSGCGIGLVHSGRKGSELGVVSRAVEKMKNEIGCKPARMLAVISPCIRPPNYEVDFVSQIVAQLHECGVEQIYDSGTCTAANPDRYYSYRREKGRTGRMMALLAIV